jgi:beta-barrel assembly-enhancing protease
VSNHRFSRWIAVILGALFINPLLTHGQTRIEAPKTSYSISEEVRIGQQASQEVERQLQIMPEGGVVDNYVERVGRRLVEAIPPQFQHKEFQYEFDVVNASDINAFALPGGPMYINRGMIQAARSEGEMAGVMAHEIAHVALRHGTAQATKARKYQLGALAGSILGAIIGGGWGELISQGSQFGISTYFLKFSREYERQADILGAQIMARAGYDPRDLANMFRTIERQGGSRGPEWLSSHPSPQDRYERINEEAALLRVNPNTATQNTEAFRQIQSQLSGMPAAPTTAQSSRGTTQPTQRVGQVERPSNRYKTYTGNNQFRLSVPENWRELNGSNSATFAPEGAYGTAQDQFIFTHGVQAGTTRVQSNDLRQATDQLIRSLLQSNPGLRMQRGYRRGVIDGANGLRVRLAGESPVTGRYEIVDVYTRFIHPDNLFYLITVAPRNEYRAYSNVFNRVRNSVQISRQARLQAS